jgi:hypothetical protein
MGKGRASMKKDIAYIKFIKPQIARKEKQDKQDHREKEYQDAMRIAGLKSPGVDVTDLGLIIGILRAKQEGEEPK